MTPVTWITVWFANIFHSDIGVYVATATDGLKATFKSTDN